MVSSEFSVCRQEVSFLLCTAGGKRTTEPIARRHASGAGKPNGWLVAPTYFRGSRPSSPRPSGPLHSSFHSLILSCWCGARTAKALRVKTKYVKNWKNERLEFNQMQFWLETNCVNVRTISCAYF